MSQSAINQSAVSNVDATAPATAAAPAHRPVHNARLVFAVVFVVGMLLNLANAFHGQLWFDESYSTALVQHGFADIWRIGSADVHPVLYYWVLHLVYLAFGPSLVAYRSFSLVCTAALALLGWTHVRRDCGERAGILFATFVLFSPWTMIESVDIRMYAWAALLVGVTLIYTRRVAATVVAGENAPLSWWTIAFACALASAYSHYYAAMAAFCCMVVLLVACVAACRHGNRAPVARFVAGAVLCLVGYLPWIHAAATQVSGVSSSYWITFSFPFTLFDFVGFPLRADTLISVGLDGNQGVFWQVATLLLRACFWVALVVALADLIRRCCIASVRRNAVHVAAKAAEKDLGLTSGALSAVPSRLDHVAATLVDPLAAAAVVFFGTMLLSGAASVAMRQSIMMQRYMHCATAGMALLFATQFDRMGGRRLATLGAVCFVLLGGVTSYWNAQSNYSPTNNEVVDYYREVTRDADGNVLLVFSAGDIGDNICAVGPLSQLVPEAHVHIPDVAPSYEAYTPQATLSSDLPALLDGYHGEFVYVSNGNADENDDIQQFADECDATVVSTEQFWRPYRSNVWTISVMRK